jgi:hypothetical protein
VGAWQLGSLLGAVLCSAMTYVILTDRV